MKYLFIWTFLLSLLGCSKANSQFRSEKISLEKIQEMFTSMENEGSNLEQKLLWSYFFISNKKDKLEQVAKELKKQNFEFVEIYQDDENDYWLHLERIEIHNPNSLFKLDEKLYQIADKYAVNFDGFEVDSADKEGIERNTYFVPEEFKTLAIQEENFPKLLIANSGFILFPHKEEFSYFIKINVPYKSGGKGLLPTDKELKKLDDFEFFIEKLLNDNSIKNYYVFRDTYKGSRNFFLVTNDKAKSNEVINQLKSSGKQREFNFEIISDKNWSLYSDFMNKISQE